MSADSTPTEREGAEVVGVLAAHDWRWAIRDSRTGDGVRIACTAIGCEWYAERHDLSVDVWAEHRAHIAEALAPLIAERERVAAERALLGFVEWVARSRAYNGSDYPRGQSLYNECLNEVLSHWADDYLLDHDDTYRTGGDDE